MSKVSKSDLLCILRDALKLEQDGARFFRDSLQRVENTDAAKAILRLIDEEEEHIRLISRSIEALEAGQGVNPNISIGRAPAGGGYFDEEAQREFLRQIRENPVLPDLAVFEAAWRMEKEIMDFYEEAADRSDGPVRKILMVLHEFEKKHETFFRAYHGDLSDLYARVYREHPWV
ncbi:MAG: hypothetical protein CVU64_08060 [Deltaproteobacteria bacterium HGW-Deltaproteobacteria-21]|jgi:rubrerythrin|nr:MAG: hypothetical protein CVU64_08060 [Deltaproteobacteria bacterium HGW-Deltaproteobacteria-21]